MNTELTSAIISTVVSTAVTLIVMFITNKSSQRQELEKQLDEIIKIGIQNPKFEQHSFTDQWKSRIGEQSIEYASYELYATLVLNYLERFGRFNNFNLAKMQKRLGVKEWINIHKAYWKNPNIPNENIEQYDKRFVALVENCLK